MPRPHRLAATVLACGLCACQSPQPSRSLSGDFDAIGTEPFWAIQVRGDRMAVQRPDHEDIAARLTSDGRAVTADGREIIVVLRSETCSDGMSDRVWPMAADVRLDGQVLKGCAAAKRH